MQEITLRAMQFHALVGVLPHERTVPQPVEIDLQVHIAEADVVIDYRGLYDVVARTIAAGPIDFLEEIATRVADEALAHNPRIRSARIAVRKPHVALPGPLAYAEVVVERRAND